MISFSSSSSSSMITGTSLGLGKLSKTDSSTLIWKGCGVGAKVVGTILLSSNTVVLSGWLVVVAGASVVVVVVVGLVLSFGRRRLREKSNFFGRFVVAASVVLLTVAASVTTSCRVVLLSSCWVVLKARKLLSVVIGTPVNCEPPVVPATVVLRSSPCSLASGANVSRASVSDLLVTAETLITVTGSSVTVV